MAVTGRGSARKSILPTSALPKINRESTGICSPKATVDSPSSAVGCNRDHLGAREPARIVLGDVAFAEAVLDDEVAAITKLERNGVVPLEA